MAFLQKRGQYNQKEEWMKHELYDEKHEFTKHVDNHDNRIILLEFETEILEHIWHKTY